MTLYPEDHTANVTHSPHFPIQERVLDKHILGLVTGPIPVEQQPVLQKFAFIRLEPLGCLGIVREHPERSDRYQNGENAFKDKDPSIRVSLAEGESRQRPSLLGPSG